MKVEETSTTTTVTRYSESKEGGIHLDAVIQQPDNIATIIYSNLDGQGAITMPAKYFDLLCTFISNVSTAAGIQQEAPEDVVETPPPSVPDPAPADEEPTDDSGASSDEPPVVDSP